MGVVTGVGAYTAYWGVGPPFRPRPFHVEDVAPVGLALETGQRPRACTAWSPPRLVATPPARGAKS